MISTLRLRNDIFTNYKGSMERKKKVNAVAALAHRQAFHSIFEQSDVFGFEQVQKYLPWACSKGVGLDNLARFCPAYSQFPRQLGMDRQ